MKLLTPLFLLLALLPPTSNYALAAEPVPAKPLKQYDVEIIIFEDAHARYINSETWPQPEQLPDSPDDHAITDTNTKVVDKNVKETGLYKNLKPGILTSEYKRINHSSEYNVLLYTAWRQDGLDKNKAFEIDISELSNTHKNQKDQNTDIEGKLKLVLARYLHIYGNLTYKRKNETDQNQQNSDQPPAIEISAQQANDVTTIAEYNIYPVKFHRKMRSKTLHYIDHPLVGILIQINQAELPEKTAE